MKRPVAQLVGGLLFGAIAAFSISLGLIATVVAFSVVVLVAIAGRSTAALSGSLMGWGLTWVGLHYIAFGMSLCNGPGCGNGGPYLPFILLGVGIFISGVAVGLFDFLRAALRDRRRSTE